MSLAERVEKRMRKLGLSQSELARRVGVSQPSINAILKGETLAPKYLHKLADELETSVAYLDGRTDDPTANAPIVPSKAEIAEQLNLELVRELRLGYSMGGGSVLDDYEQIGYRAFDRDWLRTITQGPVDRLFVAIGEGDSMQPTLMDGDTVLIDTSQQAITQQDRIWALSYGDLGMIKRVRRLPGGMYRVLSDNPAVAPIDAVDDEMFVVGRVVWIGRRI